MTDLQFTPGPWETEHDRSDIHILGSDFVGGSQTIATVYTRSNGPDCEAVAHANANLIAALPVLLAAAEKALNFFVGVPVLKEARDVQAALEAAIARATGAAS